MKTAPLTAEVLALGGSDLVGLFKGRAVVLMILGLAGFLLAALVAAPRAVWSALLTATVIIIGVAVVGPLLSAIFEITGAKWGRAYRRLAEASVALMPLGLVSLIVLMAAGNAYLPWVHEHPHLGGKTVWLTRGFWDIRVLVTLLIVYAVGFAFVRLSIRRDFCESEVRAKFGGRLARWITGEIAKPAVARRCTAQMAVLAPIVAIVYAVCFTLLGIDLIMALEPDWFSTLFGAWYFVGNIFTGLSLLAIVSIMINKKLGLGRFITKNRQSDLATLLLAFCLLNVDFFWNQYLTIWYANLPEETFYLIERTADTELGWRSWSFVSLATFFVIPFLALLMRKVKRSEILLTTVAAVSLCGIFLARFIEIAPALLPKEAASGGALTASIAAAALVFVGFLGAAVWLYSRFLSGVPIMPVSDQIFVREASSEEGHG